MIANGARCFTGDSSVPKSAVQSVTNLNFHFTIDFVVKKAAVARKRFARSHNHGEL